MSPSPTATTGGTQTRTSPSGGSPTGSTLGEGGAAGADSGEPLSPAGAASSDDPPPEPLQRTSGALVDLLDDRGPAPVPSIDPGALRDRCLALLERLPVAVARLSVRLLDDASMAALHERHLGIPGPTDVLTFSEPAVDRAVDPAVEGAALEVDLAIGASVAAREAAGREHPFEHEVLLYVVHGLLHALGHGDHDPDDAARMHAEEDRLLEAIGVGRVFDRPLGRPASADANVHETPDRVTTVGGSDRATDVPMPARHPDAAS